MPKLSDSAIPKYRLHHPSGQAVVTLAGREHNLGPHGTAASKRMYDRLVGEWLAAGKPMTLAAVAPGGCTIAELVAAFAKHARAYYRDASGNPTSEVEAYRQAFEPLLKLYKSLPAAEFSPLKLKAVRDAMIRAGSVRTSINKHAGRIRHMFKWASANELVPASVFHGLLSVEGLKAGRSEAPEPEAVTPVPSHVLDATLPFTTPATIHFTSPVSHAAA